MYNIKMQLKECEWMNVEWINIPQDREKWQAVVNAVMNFHVP
jgi:hypothetical protein